MHATVSTYRSKGLILEVRAGESHSAAWEAAMALATGRRTMSREASAAIALAVARKARAMGRVA